MHSLPSPSCLYARADTPGTSPRLASPQMSVHWGWCQADRAGPSILFGRTDSEDLAPAVVFFASDESAFVTGQTLSVSGGLTMV